MKGSKWTKRIVSVALAGVLGCGGAVGLAACKGNGDRALVIMTEELNGLFNPFYSTAGTDMDVVGQTQISMLATDNEGKVSYGNEEPCLVLDYDQTTTGTGDAARTEYRFVLKNGLKFSDGYAVTMNDVLFNMYVYLDPAYTGSTTMYSTKIDGLQSYRTQRNVSGDGTAEEDALTTQANGRASNRINELIAVFHTFETQPGAGTYSASELEMRDKISTWAFQGSGYKKAIAKNGEISDADARAQLLADYNDTLTEFRTELENDYKAAKDSFSEEPYKSAPIYATGGTKLLRTGFDEVTAFMFMEGFATVEYGKDAQQKEDRTKIEKITLGYNNELVTTQDAAIDHVYKATVQPSFDNILSYWATAGTMRTNFASKARDVILHENLTGNQLAIDHISGISSLGHDASFTASEVTVNNHTYKLAKTHNEDASSKDFGKPSNEGEYDILRIVVDGTDPKAIWNFGFTVAPYHYYSDPSSEACKMDIKNNKFGVEWGSFDFMTKVIQGNNANGQSKNKVPLGAGPYVATDKDNNDNPAGNAFIADNVVYYKANENFSLDGTTSNKPKIENMRYQVVSSSNALNQLKSGSVHFVEPQYTPENYKELTGMVKDGFKSLDTWQLGYGYIGINAGKVKNIYLRRAIMAAMNTKLALEYYGDAAANIYWPMSLVSWAYPREAGYTYNPERPLDRKLDDNGTDYAGPFLGDTEAIAMINKYMGLAGNYSQSELKLTFTIAGANLTEHPCFQVFKHAADLLNSCGWSVEVMPDVNALTKLSTGSLAVWAAAWGSTIDPDMYQVYDKHSTASSTYAWGYREILASESTYPDENRILNELSELIMDARETMDEEIRKPLYKQAMKLVLDLAVELPVYQRKALYAYNSNVIDENSFPKGSDGKVLINSYASPLSRIWDLEFKK